MKENLKTRWRGYLALNEEA